MHQKLVGFFGSSFYLNSLSLIEINSHNRGINSNVPSQHTRVLNLTQIRQHITLCFQTLNEARGMERLKPCTMCDSLIYIYIYFKSFFSFSRLFFGDRYSNMSEEEFAARCPVCRNNCNCKSCLRMKGLDEVCFY
jgi:hypothetical protein